MVLNAVHKRSGNRDPSSHRATVAAGQTTCKQATTAAGGGGSIRKKAQTSSTAASVTPPAIEIKAAVTRPHTGGVVRTATAARPRKISNVFEQFTPKRTLSPFDLDFSINDGGKSPFTYERSSNKSNTNRCEVQKISKNNKITLRLQSLLRDDTGEQEMELFPDSSPEAAEQLADLKSYNKLNEEARRKANLAVSQVEEDDDGAGVGDNSRRKSPVKRKYRDEVRRQYVEAAPSNNDMANLVKTTSSYSSNSILVAGAAPRQHRVRATVKETGSDSISTYIKSLGQHELLFKDDEILLGRQVRILSGLEEKRHELELQLLRPPTFAQWAVATDHTVPSLKQQIRRSQRAKAALIEANLRLVVTVARQAVKRSPSTRQSNSASSVQFQDACQQGIIGLTRATEKFDPELGFRFSTYAIWWIRKEVAKNVSEQSRPVRVPPGAIRRINDISIQERVLMNELGRRPHDEELADRVGMTVEKLNFYRQSAKEVRSLDKKIDARTGKGSMSTGGGGSDGDTMDIFVRDTEHPSPTELVDEQMLKDDIRRLVRTLSPREQAVIRLRFGLDDGSEPLGLADISAKFGVEKERIKKIEARALLKLRQPNRSLVVRCYVSDHT
ncbi:hypothetical protein ACHAW5_002246 [Stephanodiscus triporus]|uniref:RNA polymerase sigma-70 domain-containing protein n=1 Tax=Stephanodiscus triporus TaxID=2934178 RepID=A0ABD3NGZ1_9STRA